MNEEEHRYMRLSQAAAFVAAMTGEKKPSVQTLHRWVHRGLANVRLQTIYIGGVRRVSPEMLQQFFAAVTAAKAGAIGAPADAVMPQRSSHAARDRAEQDLRDDGI